MRSGELCYGSFDKDKEKFLIKCLNDEELCKELKRFYPKIPSSERILRWINEFKEVSDEPGNGWKHTRLWYEIDADLMCWVSRFHFAKYRKKEYETYYGRIKYLKKYITDCRIDSWMKEIKEDPEFLLDSTTKTRITTMYNDLLISQGKYKRPKRVSYKDWDEPYLKMSIGRLSERNKDFYSCDAIFSLRSKFSASEAQTKQVISENLNMFKQTALDGVYEKLSKSRFKDVQKNYLQIKKIVYRQGFNELLVTVGLKDEILKLKEELEKEIN